MLLDRPKLLGNGLCFECCEITILAQSDKISGGFAVKPSRSHLQGCY